MKKSKQFVQGTKIIYRRKNIYKAVHQATQRKPSLWRYYEHRYMF